LYTVVFDGTFIQHDPLICTLSFHFHVYRPVYAVLTRTTLFVGFRVLCMILACRLLNLLFSPEDGGRTLLRNIYCPAYTASHLLS
jgi:hypothetical protein